MTTVLATQQQQQQQPNHATPSGSLARWTPSLPTSLMNLFNPFTNDETTNKQLAGNGSPRPAIQRSMFDGPPSPSSSSIRSNMFAEPDNRSTSEADSREGSIDMMNKRFSKGTRPKTRYSICHPPSASLTRAKLHRRPRSLLQLHKLQSGSRPTPAVDVIPSHILNVRLTRTAAKIFKSGYGLFPTDLLVLQAERYSAPEEEEDDEDDEQDAHNIIGLICKARKEDTVASRARICVANGKEWEASCLPNGGYEFTCTDDHGLVLTVRWVYKRNKDKENTASRTSDLQPKRFNFSTISPNSRRHPIIAVLSPSGLDINDCYRMPVSTQPNSPISTPHQTSSTISEAMENDISAGFDAEVGVCDTDAELKELIILTSIWVAFKEGWSPTFRYDDKDKDRDPGIARSPSFQMSPTKGGETPPVSPALHAIERQGSIRSISNSLLRKGSLRRAHRSSIVSSVPSVDETDESIPGHDYKSSHVRKRADSAATIYVNAVPTHHRKTKTQATWRPDLLITKSSIMEASRESSSPIRPVQTKRASWQAYSSETNGAPPGEHATPLHVNVEHSDHESKARSSVADTSSESGAEGNRMPQSQLNMNMLKPPSAGKAPRKRKSGGSWRRLWCGRDLD